MGQKNTKGTVSITKFENRIRLRWRYQNKRYSLNLNEYTKINLGYAKKKAVEIEYDLLNGQFDFTLNKYKPVGDVKKLENTIVEYFEEWTSTVKQMDCDKNSDYFMLRNALKSWGIVTEQNILSKLNAGNYSPKTYNRRLSMLKGFIKWLVKLSIWKFNALEDVDNRRNKKVKNPSRKPFTEEEIKKVLAAFKNDTYCSKNARYKHSHYYPFIYFIFKMGVRNAEAIGLRIGSVDFGKMEIHIKEVLARTVNGTHAAARVRKETKNGKERYLPLTEDLDSILKPLCNGKDNDELVFKSFSGLPIDDRMFQRRVFKPILKELGIEDRVLYACRHTFGSRCIDEGITPVMTAFLMGNNPETALRNYTHQITIPKDLPSI